MYMPVMFNLGLVIVCAATASGIVFTPRLLPESLSRRECGGIMKLPRWLRRCKHTHKRCLHGDEIMKTWRASWGSRRIPFARVECLNCGKPLYKEPLMEICTITYKPHESKGLK